MKSSSGILSNKLPVQGPAIEITTEMILTAILKMKCGKAAGPSGIIIEMIKAAGDKNAEELTVLVNRIVAEGIVPSDWNLSIIINLIKGKGDALLRGNYRGLKPRASHESHGTHPEYIHSECRLN